MFARNSSYRRPWRNRLRFSLVAVLVMAMINVGCYVWINNSVAVIPDADPATMVLLEMYDDFDHGPGDPSDDVYTSPRPDGAGSRAQAVVRGNGARGDNRAEVYSYRRGASSTLPPKNMKSASTFNERYTAVALRDFGHLKVMPAGDGVSNNGFQSFRT